LIGKPIHGDPLADCSGGQVALIREIVKSKGATARQIEMVEHLVHGHRPPLTRRLKRRTLYTLAILVPLLLREEAIPIHLFQLQRPGNVPNHGESRHQDVGIKSERSRLMRLLLQDQGWRHRLRQGFEPQVLANPGVYYASGGKSAEPSRAAGNPARRVAKFRASRSRGLHYDIRHDARLFCSRGRLLQPLAHGGTNLAVLIELRVSRARRPFLR
jgi:hypothetical protein